MSQKYSERFLFEQDEKGREFEYNLILVTISEQKEVYAVVDYE